jgi:hypothetical protein
VIAFHDDPSVLMLAYNLTFFFLIFVVAFFFVRHKCAAWLVLSTAFPFVCFDNDISFAAFDAVRW